MRVICNRDHVKRLDGEDRSAWYAVIKDANTTWCAEYAEHSITYGVPDSLTQNFDGGYGWMWDDFSIRERVSPEEAARIRTRLDSPEFWDAIRMEILL